MQTAWNQTYHSPRPNAFPVKTGEAELLVQRYQQFRDERARALLLHRYERMIRMIARRFLHSGEPLEDLAQEGTLGLIRAIELYDRAKGAGFTTYAACRIASALDHYVRDRSRLIRQPAWIQERGSRVRRERERLTLELGREPEPHEIARSLELPEDQIIEAIEQLRLSECASLDETLGEDRDITRGETLIGEEGGFQWENFALQQSLERLTDFERNVIHLIYFQDYTQREAARKMGTSLSRLRRSHASALQSLQLDMAA